VRFDSCGISQFANVPEEQLHDFLRSHSRVKRRDFDGSDPPALRNLVVGLHAGVSRSSGEEDVVQCIEAAELEQIR
jgi:hypothetical protein